MFDNLVFRQLFDAASSTYTYVLGDPVDGVYEAPLLFWALGGSVTALPCQTLRCVTNL